MNMFDLMYHGLKAQISINTKGGQKIKETKGKRNSRWMGVLKGWDKGKIGKL